MSFDKYFEDSLVKSQEIFKLRNAELVNQIEFLPKKLE